MTETGSKGEINAAYDGEDGIQVSVVDQNGKVGTVSNRWGRGGGSNRCLLY